MIIPSITTKVRTKIGSTKLQTNYFRVFCFFNCQTPDRVLLQRYKQKWFYQIVNQLLSCFFVFLTVKLPRAPKARLWSLRCVFTVFAFWSRCSRLEYFVPLLQSFDLRCLPGNTIYSFRICGVLFILTHVCIYG